MTVDECALCDRIGTDVRHSPATDLYLCRLCRIESLPTPTRKETNMTTRTESIAIRDGEFHAHIIQRHTDYFVTWGDYVANEYSEAVPTLAEAFRLLSVIARDAHGDISRTI